MVQCKKCKLFVSLNKDDIVQCKGSCESVFHKTCIKNIKQFMQSGLCESCNESSKQTNSGTLKTKFNESETNFEQILQEINKKLEVVYKMKKTLEDLAETVDFYAEQYQKLTEFKGIAEKKIVSLEQKNVYLEKYSGALEERICELEERGLERNIEIVGVEKNGNENIHTVVANIAQMLKVNPSDIESAKRVGREKITENKYQPVVVTLKSKTVRDQWLASRKLVFTNDSIYKNKSSRRIYINENLTKYKRQLLWETKLRLRETFKYVWIQNSKILVRGGNDDSKIYKIGSEKDIDRLLKNETPTSNN